MIPTYFLTYNVKIVLYIKTFKRYEFVMANQSIVSEHGVPDATLPQLEAEVGYFEHDF